MSRSGTFTAVVWRLQEQPCPLCTTSLRVALTTTQWPSMASIFPWVILKRQSWNKRKLAEWSLTFKWLIAQSSEGMFHFNGAAMNIIQFWKIHNRVWKLHLALLQSPYHSIIIWIFVLFILGIYVEYFQIQSYALVWVSLQFFTLYNNFKWHQRPVWILNMRPCTTKPPKYHQNKIKFRVDSKRRDSQLYNEILLITISQFVSTIGTHDLIISTILWHVGYMYVPFVNLCADSIYQLAYWMSLT